MGDGSLHAKGPRFCVAERRSADVAERVRSLVKSLFNLDSGTLRRRRDIAKSASIPFRLRSGGRPAASRNSRPTCRTQAARAIRPARPRRAACHKRSASLWRVPARPLRSGRHGDKRRSLLDNGAPGIRRGSKNAPARAGPADNDKNRRFRVGTIRAVCAFGCATRPTTFPL